MTNTAARRIKTWMRRAAAYLLAFIFILGTMPALAEVSNVNAYNISGGSDKVTVYVRAFVPGKHSKPTSIGHFDFMIKGTVKFRGKTFTNPVFSYRMEDSTLDVFDESDTGKIYPHGSFLDYYYDCNVYQARYTSGTRNDLKEFLKTLNGMVASSSRHPRASGAIKCRIKSSNPFSKYRMTSTNCFCAVAMWLKCFGDSSLMNYYKGAHDGRYRVYFPNVIVKHFSGKFKYKYSA